MRDYFSGRYYKIQNDKNTVAIIPSVSKSRGKCTPMIQIITDYNSYCVIPSDFHISDDKKTLYFDNCEFSDKGIIIKISKGRLFIYANLRFGVPTKPKYDIMGPFKHIPFMQCKHHVYSMLHEVYGYMNINGKSFDFSNATGYTEGDSGYSFPKSYLWTQCNYKDKLPSSIMLAAADIPFLGGVFKGITGIIYHNGIETRIATYLGAKVTEYRNNFLNVRQGNLNVSAELLKDNQHELFAPSMGQMSRIIKENPSCTVLYKLSKNGQTIFNFSTPYSSFEFSSLSHNS